MLVPTQPQPSHVLANTDRKWEAPHSERPPASDHVGIHDDVDFDVDDFYDNVPCTD